MHYQHGLLDAFEVLGEIGLRERHDPVVMGLCTADHALTPPVADDAFGRRGTWAVVAVERPGRHIAVELRTVARHLGLEAVEHGFGQASRIVWGLHHQRRYGGDQDCLGHFVARVAGHVAHYLAAAGGVADMHRPLNA
ncbi:hypothetical protein D3C80_1464120 [compost metagenome]